MSALGAILFRAASIWQSLAGNTSATKKFLTQTGTGAVSAAPGWNTIVAGDLPNTAVTPGSYTATNLTVDAQGRITAAANGGGSFGNVTTSTTLTSGKTIVGNGTTDVTVSSLTATVVKSSSGTASAATAGTDYVAPGAVTTSGLTQATAKLLGRTTASTGAIEEISVGSGLSLSAGSLTASGTGGTVTNTGTLTNHALVKGNGGVDVSTLSSLGTTTTLLHGNASGDPTFGAVDLANDVTGNLGVSHLNSGTSASATTYWSGAGTWSTPAGTSNKLAQIVSSLYSAVATGSTQIPSDDTIPQNTEGDEYMTCTITPTNSSSTLVITVTMMASTNTAVRHVIAALFQDSIANALAASIEFLVNAASVGTFHLPTYTMTAGTTSATTFKVRMGLNGSGTVTFNGVSGGRLYGAIPKSSIVIMEILP